MPTFPLGASSPLLPFFSLPPHKKRPPSPNQSTHSMFDQQCLIDCLAHTENHLWCSTWAVQTCTLTLTLAWNQLGRQQIMQKSNSWHWKQSAQLTSTAEARWNCCKSRTGLWSKTIASGLVTAWLWHKSYTSEGENQPSQISQKVHPHWMISDRKYWSGWTAWRWGGCWGSAPIERY